MKRELVVYTGSSRSRSEVLTLWLLRSYHSVKVERRHVLWIGFHRCCIDVIITPRTRRCWNNSIHEAHNV